MWRKNILLLALIVLGLALIVDGSSGDRSQIFNDCLDRCHSYNCTRSGSATLSRHDLTQPLYLTLLGWSCIDECKYTCMWVTVDKFVRVYKYDVPQFYGKWPFVRLFGLQEPASVLASLLNLFASCYMIKKLIKQVRMTRRTPFKWLWYSFSAVCINTWIWSTIFHTRDLWLTEIMDYFSAFLLVLSQLNVFFVRALWPHQTQVMFVLNSSSLIYYIYHCYYLSMIKFDYGYNMTVNIVVGLVNSACWIAWSSYYYLRHKRRMKYMWRCAFSFVLFDLLMVLEIFDFSPIWWTFDSHALWHFSTIVIPLQWFQFIIDDVTFMQFEATYEKLT